MSVGRNQKKGIDYFPLDVNFDNSIEMVIARFGDQAMNVVIRLWQMIYANEGYYIIYDEDTIYMLSRKCIDVDENYVKSVIDYMIKKDIFDINKFEEYNILTSKRIQSNYKTAIRLRKTNDINNNNYVIKDISNVRKEQSKVKESKVNKSKEEKTTKKENNDVGVVSLKLQELGVVFNSLILDTIETWLESHSLEMIELAIIKAAHQNKRNVGYINGILNNWYNDGIVKPEHIKTKSKDKGITPEWYDQYDEEFKNRTKPQNKKDVDLETLKNQLEGL